MAATLQPTVGGVSPPDSQPKTYTSALLSSSSSLPPIDFSNLTTHGTHRGLPSIVFSDSENTSLSKPFTWTLIGKFSQGYNKKDPKLGRPSVSDLQKFLHALDFKGLFHLGLLDNRHLLIQFQREEDYIRMFSRTVWYVGRVTMRIFKWSPFFRVGKESLVVPIWISLPRLPVHLFQKSPLFSIARIFGHPLRLDDATASLKRPSVARVQVQIDVLQELPDKIWIQLGTQEGFWQSVDFENVPFYCCNCWHIGHSQDFCRVQDSASRPVINRTPQPQQVDNHNSQPAHIQQKKTKQMYVRKESAPSAKVSKNASSDKPLDNPTVKKSSLEEDHLQANAPHQQQDKVLQMQPQVASSLFDQQIVVLSQSTEPAPAHDLEKMVVQEIGFPPKHIMQLPPVAPEILAIIPFTGGQEPAMLDEQHQSKSGNLQEFDELGAVALRTDAPTCNLNGETTVDALVVHHQSNVTDIVSSVAEVQRISEDSFPMPQSQQLDLTKNRASSSFVNVVKNFAVPQRPECPYFSVAGAAPVEEDVNTVANPTAQRQPLAILNPNATEFHLPSNASRVPTYTGYEGYDDNSYFDSYGSEENEYDDEEDRWSPCYEDMTDGSEDKHLQRRKDKKKQKARVSQSPITQAAYLEDSRKFGIKLQKRERPPGARNRTYFGTIRTMETRASKSKSTSN